MNHYGHSGILTIPRSVLPMLQLFTPIEDDRHTKGETIQLTNNDGTGMGHNEPRRLRM